MNICINNARRDGRLDCVKICTRFHQVLDDMKHVEEQRYAELARLKTGVVQAQFRNSDSQPATPSGRFRKFYYSLANVESLDELLKGYLEAIRFSAEMLYSEQHREAFKIRCNEADCKTRRQQWIGDTFELVVLGVMSDKERFNALTDLSHFFGWTKRDFPRTTSPVDEKSKLWISQSLNISQVRIVEDSMIVQDGDDIVTVQEFHNLRGYIILRNRKEAAACCLMLEKLEGSKKGYRLLHGSCEYDPNDWISSVSTITTDIPDDDLSPLISRSSSSIIDWSEQHFLCTGMMDV